MNPGLYYHILQIGATYEKGHKRGKLWLLRERSRLRCECALWRKLINAKRIRILNYRDKRLIQIAG